MFELIRALLLFSDCEKTVERLIKGGADASIPNQFGETPLNIAKKKGEFLKLI